MDDSAKSSLLQIDRAAVADLSRMGLFLVLGVLWRLLSTSRGPNRTLDRRNAVLGAAGAGGGRRDGSDLGARR